MDIWWYLGLFRFRWFCILNYSIFSLVFGATAASVWFPACGGGLLHAMRVWTHAFFQILQHWIMQQWTRYIMLCHQLWFMASQKYPKLQWSLSLQGQADLSFDGFPKYTCTPCTLSKMVSDLCDINVYETSAHRIEGQISGKTARVSTFWLSHRSVVPYTLFVLRFVFETFYGPTWIANTFACCVACWHDQTEVSVTYCNFLCFVGKLLCNWGCERIWICHSILFRYKVVKIILGFHNYRKYIIYKYIIKWIQISRN